MTRWAGNAKWIAASFLSAVVSLSVTSCRLTSPRSEKTLPTIAEVRSRIGAPAASRPDVSSAAPAVVAQIVLVDLPQDAWPAWDDLARICVRGGVPAEALQAWGNNGLYVGIVNPDKTEALSQALAPAVNTRKIQSTVTRKWAALVAASPRGDFTEFRPVASNTAITEPWDQGRCQMLIRRAEGADGDSAVVVELVPHYFKPQPRVQPRTPYEKSLDGRIFDELSLRVALEPGQWLIVLPVLPSPPEAPEPPETAAPPLGSSSEQRQEVAGESSRGIAPSILSKDPQGFPIDFSAGHYFGHHLLCGKRYGKPVATILLISVASVSAAAPTVGQP